MRGTGRDGLAAAPSAVRESTRRASSASGVRLGLAAAARRTDSSGSSIGGFGQDGVGCGEGPYGGVRVADEVGPAGAGERGQGQQVRTVCRVGDEDVKEEVGRSQWVVAGQPDPYLLVVVLCECRGEFRGQAGEARRDPAEHRFLGRRAGGERCGACGRTRRTDKSHEEVVGDVAACPRRSRVAAGGVGQGQMAVYRRPRQPAHLVLPVPHPPLRRDRARSGDVLHLLLGPAQTRLHDHPPVATDPALSPRKVSRPNCTLFEDEKSPSAHPPPLPNLAP